MRGEFQCTNSVFIYWTVPNPSPFMSVFLWISFKMTKVIMYSTPQSTLTLIDFPLQTKVHFFAPAASFFSDSRFVPHVEGNSSTQQHALTVMMRIDAAHRCYKQRSFIINFKTIHIMYIVTIRTVDRFNDIFIIARQILVH